MKKLIAIVAVFAGAGALAFSGCSNTQPQSSCFVQAADTSAPFFVKYTVESENGDCRFLGQHMQDGKVVAGDSLGVSIFGAGTSQSIGVQPLSISHGTALSDGSLTAVGDFNGDTSSCSAASLSAISASITDPNLNLPEVFPRLLGFDGGCALLEDGGIGFVDGGSGCVIDLGSSSSSGSGSSSGSVSSSSDSSSSSGSGSGSTTTSTGSGSGSGSTTGVDSSSSSSSSTSSGSGSTGSGSGSTTTSGSGSSGSGSTSGSSGSTGADGGLPMVQATYTFTQVKFVQAGNIAGIELSAELQYNQTPLTAGATECHATIHVDGIWYDNSSLASWSDGGTPTDIITAGPDGGPVDRGNIGNHCDVDSDCTADIFKLPGGGTDFQCLPLISAYDDVTPCNASHETAAVCNDPNADPDTDCVCGAPDHCIVTDTATGDGFCGETGWDGGVAKIQRCVPKSVPAGATDCETNCSAD